MWFMHAGSGEMRVSFEKERDREWKVLCDGVTVIPDGRPVSEFVASRAVARTETSPARESSGE